MATSEKITITPGKVTEVVEILRTEQIKIKTYKKTLDNELEKVNNAWEGIDAIRYTKRMRDDYALLLEEFNKSLASYIDFLEKVYSEYERFDNEFSEKRINIEV